MNSSITITPREVLETLGRTELHARMALLLGDERNIAVEFLRHLDVFDQQRGWRQFDDPRVKSVRDYCLQILGLREGAAHRRIHAMLVLRRFPQVEPMLRDGRLCMSILTDLEPILTGQNADDLFQRASGKSTRYVQDEIIAEMKDRVPEKEELRELKEELARMSAETANARKAEIEASGGSVEDTTATLSDEVAKEVDARLEKMTFLQHKEKGRNRARKVSRTQGEVTVTLDLEAYERLIRLRERLGLKPAEVLARGLQELEKLLDKKDGKTPRRHGKEAVDPTTIEAEGDYIPIELANAVRQRDGYRCRNCGSAGEPELDHVLSKARGGKTTYDNLQQLCGPCNREKARLELGDEFVDAKIFERMMEKARREDAASLPAPEVTFVDDGPLPEEPPGFWDGWEVLPH